MLRGRVSVRSHVGGSNALFPRLARSMQCCVELLVCICVLAGVLSAQAGRGAVTRYSRRGDNGGGARALTVSLCLSDLSVGEAVPALQTVSCKIQSLQSILSFETKYV